MPLTLARLIIYVRDFPAAKAFYVKHFELPVTEEIEGEWVVFDAGAVELALHLMGERYRERLAEPSAQDADEKPGPTTKIVFKITSDLAAHREKLKAAGVRVGKTKRYDGFPYEMYDGRDPEGNVFQVMRED